jgi:hypothetical protein
MRLKEDYLKCTDVADLDSIKGLKFIRPAADETDVEVKININDRDVDISYVYPARLILGKSEMSLGPFKTNLQIPLGADFIIAKRLLGEAISNKPGYYDLNSRCEELKMNSPLVNIHQGNDVILINDFTTFYDKLYYETYQLRFMVSGLKVSGRCAA